MAHKQDLGHDHQLYFLGWHPDRALNPQYDGVADVDRFSAVIEHKRADGTPCSGVVHFDTPEVRAVDEASRRACAVKGIPYHDYPRWTVGSWEPLTLSPSVLCECGDHGFVCDGKWVAA